jgi:hypothetical protein
MKAPEPTVIDIDVNGGRTKLINVVDAVLARAADPRVVLNVYDSKDEHSGKGRGRPKDLLQWARDPLGSWGDAIVDKRGYKVVPGPTNPVGFFRGNGNILDNVYMCSEFLRRESGNRACFNKCM